MRPEAPISSAKAKAKGLATSVWGRAWCTNLERYSFYAGRLPQGRTLLRRGQVCDLQIEAGRLVARVEDERSHEVSVRIAACDEERWLQLKERCGQVDSLLALLQAQLAAPVMALMTDADNGLFPEPSEIRCVCTCVDDADLCKHAAAALYGVGIELDAKPELLFLLRQVKVEELVKAEDLGDLSGDFAEGDLGALFGLDFDKT